MAAKHPHPWGPPRSRGGLWPRSRDVERAPPNERNLGRGTTWPLGSLPALRSSWPVLESSAIRLLTKPKSWLPLQSVILPLLTHTDRNTWRGFAGGMAAHWPLQERARLHGLWQALDLSSRPSPPLLPRAEAPSPRGAGHWTGGDAGRDGPGRCASQPLDTVLSWHP